MMGYCLSCVDDVAISSDGRCLVDNTITIAPSTLCLHVRWINGGWSACDPAARGEAGKKPCRPVAAGTWQNVLSQQARGVAKRERDAAKHRAFGDRQLGAPLASRLREKMRVGPPPPRVPAPLIDKVCPVCHQSFSVGRTKRAQICCSRACTSIRTATLLRRPMQTLVCEFEPCRATFMTSERGRRFCGRGCARRYTANTALKAHREGVAA